jgi:hypothetical protein
MARSHLNTLHRPMRNSIGVVAGVLFSIILSVTGSRLAWLLIIGNVGSSENKDAIVRCMLWQSFFVVPVMCVLVGGVVASIAAKPAWWLGGIATLPLFIYGFVQGAHGLQIVLSAIYIAIAFAAAYVVSRLKRRIDQRHVQQTLGAESR